MNESTGPARESNPQMDRASESARAAQTSVPAEPATDTPAADESEELDRVRRNPASEGSNYGFGTPAEGFGQKRHCPDKPKGT